jgi:energy-coupling factor transporter transmembrane protein EcfT
VSDERPTRRDLMKPVQLLGLAFGAAIFAGIVTLVSMGFFQTKTAAQHESAVMLALIIAGVSFIAVLVIVALLLLAVDPAQVTKTIDHGVLRDDEDDETDAAASGDTPEE